MSTATEDVSVSSPEQGSDSRGSSVSSSLREEYEDLLRYAVVTPIFETKLPSKGGPTLKKPAAIPQAPKPHSNTPKRLIQTEISKVEFDDDLSVTASESEHSAPPDLQHSETVPASVASGRSHDPSPGSGDQVPESHDEEVLQPLMVDPEMARLENQMDIWCLDLKRNVMAEFDQARIRMTERHRSELQKERQQHAYEMRQLREELERYKELLVTYEQSITRKDHVISNLTRGLQKQKEKVELQRSFSSWKLRHTDEKRESFTSVLARRHHHLKLKAHVWGAWFGVIQERWKSRVEKACQSKAEEVCVQLTEEYEERLAAVHHSLDESQQEVTVLKAERALYEENMKKAFMRGVCALNLEAMSMFRYHDSPPESQQATGHPNEDEDEAPSSVPLRAMPPARNDVTVPPQATVPLVDKPHRSATDTTQPQHRINLTASVAPVESSNLDDGSGRGALQKKKAEESRKLMKKQSSGAVRASQTRTGSHKKRDAPIVIVQRHQIN